MGQAGAAHTWFAGSWTLFNTHDIAISSGLAAAERLGAPYPFAHNRLATATYKTVFAASHLNGILPGWLSTGQVVARLVALAASITPTARGQKHK